jgi:hypothetical protein
MKPLGNVLVLSAALALGLTVAIVETSSPAKAQPAQVQVNADCVIQFNLTATGQTAPATGGFANGIIGCNSWQIQYWNNGFTGLTLTIQSAPNTATAPAVCTPGTWGTLGGTAVFGANPNTNTTGASALIQSYGTNFAPCVRVLLNGLTGTGNVTGVLLGYRAAGFSGGSSSGPTSNVNVSQFGGNNVVTGTGASGSGIPRVTVSNDSAVTQGSPPWFNVPVLPPATNGTQITALTQPYYTNATSTTTFNEIKGTEGNVFGYAVENPNATVCWLQFYNSASPTLGSSIYYSVPILGSGGIAQLLPYPVNFGTAISIATTTTGNGSTPCSTGMGVTVYYY